MRDGAFPPFPFHLDLKFFVMRCDDRLARCILVAEYLVPEWADYFAGKTEEELDELAASFKFENCVRRDALNKILVAHNAAK